MANWKYISVPLHSYYDDKKREWVTEVHDAAYRSITEALNACGSTGWELVNVVLLERELTFERYRAFFKAPA